MNGSVMTAKSVFSEGLIMDFSPDNTQANSLTSALNATLLTFNGNEMALQNDMGNGRVETAYLPEGYVPIGTCEFGDIIYIVSYNPIINKSQIGCFPSPERNISSDEIGGLGASLKWTDFQGSDEYGSPNGEIISSSVKKVLYGTRNMTSGDKYIIYSQELDKAENNKYLSDYANTSHQHKRFPKLVKIHVVSIEESGKITYLDSSTKWYKENNFYIQNQKNIIDKPDLDSYRTMVSSAYSIFSSKVSGKLALLIELEKINGFSCTWGAYTNELLSFPELGKEDEYKGNEYKIYWNFNWSTENDNINPSAVVLTKSEWTGEDDTHAGQYQEWKYVKDTENNYDGWVLGGKNGEWEQKLEVPTSYPDNNYKYQTISRQYSPEDYSGTFQEFITQYSYDAQLDKFLGSTKIFENEELPQVELTKVNLSRNPTNGIPEEGTYYFNCSSSYMKNGQIKYYTNYNNKLEPVKPVQVTDDIINNYFKYPIVKHFYDFRIPLQQNIKGTWKNLNINNLIYHYELTPAMPYGLLREFSQDGYIDFKKIGTKSIALNSWRYYNYENTSTFTWGLEAYTEPNKGISEVVFIFYDNNGPAAAYHNTGKASYNGKFTEYFTLNTSGTNYKLNNKGIDGKEFYHKGEPIYKDSALESNIYLDENGNVVSKSGMDENKEYYLNDAGTLYSNCLYLVKVIIKYCNVGALGDYIEDDSQYIEDYRWYWTNTMFNEYYYSVQDFRELQFSLNLDCQAIFETVKDKWEIKTAQYYTNDDFSESINSQNSHKSLSATVQFINQDNSQNDNIKMAVRAGLQKDYNMFNIDERSLGNIQTRIFLANEYIHNYPEQPEVRFTEKDTTISSEIYPTLATNLTGIVDSSTSDTLNKLVGSTTEGTGEELYDSPTAYQNYTNNFHLSSNTTSDKEGNSSDKSKLIYIDSQTQEETETTNFTIFQTPLSNIYYDEANSKIADSRKYLLTLKGIHYSKYYYHSKLDNSPRKILKSFVANKQDLDTYSLGVGPDGKTIQYIRILFCSIFNNVGQSARFDSAIVTMQGNQISDIDSHLSLKGDGNKNIHDGLDSIADIVLPKFNFLFPMGIAYSDHSEELEKGNKPSKALLNDRKLISNNIKLERNKQLQTGDLGGTLCGISVDGAIEPGDHMRYENTLTYFTPIVLGYLTQLFHLSSDTEVIQQYLPDNYMYLQDNYSVYGRDVVIELKPNEKDPNQSSDHNSLLVFRSFSYQSYLNEVVNHVPEKDRNRLKQESNVSLQLNGCLRTAPLEVKIQYIPPAIDPIKNQDKVIVKSIYSEIPQFVSQPFTEGLVYYYDLATESFVNVGQGYSLRKLTNYNIGETSIQASLSNNTTTFGISKMKRLLTSSNGILSLQQIPSGSTSTYKIKVTEGEKQDDPMYLTGFYYKVNYYD